MWAFPALVVLAALNEIQSTAACPPLVGRWNVHFNFATDRQDGNCLLSVAEDGRIHNSTCMFSWMDEKVSAAGRLYFHDDCVMSGTLNADGREYKIDRIKIERSKQQ